MSTTAMAISEHEDTIDSRDVIERAGELAGQWTSSANGEGEPLTDDEREELDSLSALIDEAAGYAEDWEYGATLIRDSYFEDYARELAHETGMLSGNETWPLNCIDWAFAARELQMDYTSVEFRGVTYWIR